jgi:hypothetical protein
MFTNIRYFSVIILIASALPCAAQQHFFRSVGRHLGKLEWSQTALVGADAADAWTSSRAGIVELNPLLAQHGQFTPLSAAIKFSVLGAQLLSQRYIISRHPDFAAANHLRRTFTIINYAGAGMYTGVAIHNASLK